MKTLFLYKQSEKESIDDYVGNFLSLWNTVEAIAGGTPGINEGLVGPKLFRLGIKNATATADELDTAEGVSVEQVKAALLISRADQRKYRKLKDELANNYLLRLDQYLSMLKKAAQILYRTTRSLE